MVNKRKVTAEGESNQAMMVVYCPKSLRDDYDSFCSAIQTNRSQKIREHMQTDIAAWKGGKVEAPKVDLTQKNNQRVSLKKQEVKLLDMLTGEKVGRGSTFDVLKAFAIRLGTDSKLERDLESVVEKLKLYEFSGNEPFSESSLFTFIQFLETVIDRRKVEAEIKAHWKEKQLTVQI